MIYRFSELFTWSSGKSGERSDGPYPLYGSNGVIGLSDNAPYENKIILGRVGAYCGSVVFEPGLFDASDNTLITTCDEKLLDYKYAYYLLTQYNLNSFAGGAAQPVITQGILKHLKCDIPNKTKQIEVANTLSKYDRLIDLNNKRIKLLEQTAQEIYKEWFVRFRFPEHENAEFINGTPYGWIYGKIDNARYPKKWHYGFLNELGTFARGKNITASEMVEGDIPVISAGLEPSGYHNKANVFGRSITVSASGANAGYLKYNLSDIWCADSSYYQNNDNLWFVYSSLKFIQPVLSNLQVGSAQPHVYPKNLNKLNIIIPEKKYIEEYCNIVEPMFSEIAILKENNINHIKQRDYLLPRLLSGKLEVE